MPSCSRKSPWVDPLPPRWSEPNLLQPLPGSTIRRALCLQRLRTPPSVSPGLCGRPLTKRPAAHARMSVPARRTPLGRRCAAPAPQACALSPPAALGPSVPQIPRSPRGRPLQTQAEYHRGGTSQAPVPPGSASRKEHPASIPAGEEGAGAPFLPGGALGEAPRSGGKIRLRNQTSRV